MLYDEYDDYEDNKIIEPKLEDNHIFTEKVFKSIFKGTRRDLKISALEIREVYKDIKINNPKQLDKIIESAVKTIGGLQAFNTLGEKIFFELHVIFGGDKEFAKEFIKYERDYKKMAEAYHTKVTYVKMRNIIRLLNNKDKFQKLNSNQLNEDLEQFIKRL